MTCCAGSSSSGASTALTSHPWRVEVANVTLWLASFVPDLALSYLGQQPQVRRRPHWRGRPVRRGRRATARCSPAVKHVAEAMDPCRTTSSAELAENPDRTPEEVKRSEELGAAASREATDWAAFSAFDLWAAEPRWAEKPTTRLEVTGQIHVLELHCQAIDDRG